MDREIAIRGLKTLNNRNSDGDQAFVELLNGSSPLRREDRPVAQSTDLTWEYE